MQHAHVEVTYSACIIPPLRHFFPACCLLRFADTSYRGAHKIVCLQGKKHRNKLYGLGGGGEFHPVGERVASPYDCSEPKRNPISQLWKSPTVGHVLHYEIMWMSVNNTHAEKQTRHTISSQHTSHVFFTQWMDYGFNLFRCISILSFIHPLVPFFLTPNVCLSVCRSVKTNSSELLERQRWARSQTNRSSTCIWSELSPFL